jgi:hypothetical protein
MTDFKSGDKVVVSGRFYFDAVEAWVEVDGHPARVVDLRPNDMNMLRIVSTTYGTADVMESAVCLAGPPEGTWHVADTITVTIHAEPGIVDIDKLRSHLALWSGVEDVQTSIQEIHQHVTEETR